MNEKGEFNFEISGAVLKRRYHFEFRFFFIFKKLIEENFRIIFSCFNHVKKLNFLFV